MLCGFIFALLDSGCVALVVDTLRLQMSTGIAFIIMQWC